MKLREEQVLVPPVGIADPSISVEQWVAERKEGGDDNDQERADVAQS